MMFSIKKLIIIALTLQSSSCVFHPKETVTTSAIPFIDSTGYRAAQVRLYIIEREDEDSLISRALSVDQNRHLDQPEIFRSIEESYQRYLKIFTALKRSVEPEVRCSYDLIETFRLLVFDPQPFLNAILHSMSLSEVTTLDFTVEPENEDTILVHVALTRTVPQNGTRWVAFSEGEVTLQVSRHSIRLIAMRF